MFFIRGLKLLPTDVHSCPPNVTDVHSCPHKHKFVSAQPFKTLFSAPESWNLILSLFREAPAPPQKPLDWQLICVKDGHLTTFGRLSKTFSGLWAPRAKFHFWLPPSNNHELNCRSISRDQLLCFVWYRNTNLLMVFLYYRVPKCYADFVLVSPITCRTCENKICQVALK